MVVVVEATVGGENEHQCEFECKYESRGEGKSAMREKSGGNKRERERVLSTDLYRDAFPCPPIDECDTSYDFALHLCIGITLLTTFSNATREHRRATKESNKRVIQEKEKR
jgi:hypothetical protein